MRAWVGIFFRPREWILRPIFRFYPGDLFLDWLFLRFHLSWRNRSRSGQAVNRWDRWKEL